MSEETSYTPVTLEDSSAAEGPYYHGTKARLEPDDMLEAGFDSNFIEGRLSWVYFTATLDAATWGAELANGEGPGRIYRVEPNGPFEDDPNVTNKRFPGNPTKSYRSRQPLRVIEEVLDWEGHPAEALQGMLDHLAKMREQGLYVVED